VSVDDTLTVLSRASATAGVSSDGAEVIRLAENALYRLPGGVWSVSDFIGTGLGCQIG
jgi:hypothetical protein